MALKKIKILASGYLVKYWRVLETNINYADHRAHVVLGGYKDQAARDSGLFLLPGSLMISTLQTSRLTLQSWIRRNLIQLNSHISKSRKTNYPHKQSKSR